MNTASASGPFVEALSGPGRTIITATRNGAEQYATLFGGFFVDALTSETADADKNKRVSVLEAFHFAKAEVAKAYEREGPAGHRARAARRQRRQGRQPGSVGHGARTASWRQSLLARFGGRRGCRCPSDPKLRALYLERRDLERRVEALRLLKDSMAPAQYAAELEKLVTASRSRPARFATLKASRHHDRSALPVRSQLPMSDTEPNGD